MSELKKSKVLAMIPARYGSVRFPGKILAPILGKSLIQRTYENARQCELLDEIIIATDDMRIFEHVTSFGAKAVMTSPDCPTGTDRMAEALDKLPHLQDYPIVINIQGDEPCLNPNAISKVVQILIDNPEAVMSTAVVKLTSEEDIRDPSIPKCIFDKHGNALYFSRSLIPVNNRGQYSPKATYYGHLGIYAFRQHFLKQYGKLPATPLQQIEELEQLKVLEHGYGIKVAIVEEFSVGVNHPEDIKKVEQYLCKQNTSSSPAASVHR